MTPHIVALDHFAGTGWGVALHSLGILEYGAEKMPEAIRTRTRAGFRTVYRDVWSGLFASWLVPAHRLYIASPPCQSFSVAGLGAGRKALDQVLGLVADGAWKDAERLYAAGALLGDERTPLVLTPLAHIWRHRPELVALEQVPTVLPVWEAIAEVLRWMGYSVWTGNMQAEQYGVPQTRKRAIRVGFPRRHDGRGESVTIAGVEYRDRDLRDADQPSHVLTEKARSWNRFAIDGSSSPLTIADASVLQSFPAWGHAAGAASVRTAGTRPRPIGEPAATVTGSATFAWEYEDGRRRAAEPTELAMLQSYDGAFPFQGSRSKQFLQIGNAVPPRMGAAIVRELVAHAMTAQGIELSAVAS